jgi:hypothetical protein
MTHPGIAVGLLLLLVPDLPLRRAQHAVELTDAAGTVGADDVGFDVVLASLRSDGTHLTVRAQVNEPPKGLRGDRVLKMHLDTDNDATTGLEGFEFTSELSSCAEYTTGDMAGAPATSICYGDGGTGKMRRRFGIAGLKRLGAGGSEMLLWLANAEKLDSPPGTVEGRLPYAELGVKPGQTIRLLVQESYAKSSAPFAAVALTLR